MSQPKLTPTTNDIMKTSIPVSVFPSPVVEAPKQEEAPLKIALVGTAPSSRGLAPYNDPSWKIWACSAGNMAQIPRVDEWFEIHTNLLWPEHEHFSKPYLEWLSKQTFPIWVLDQTMLANSKLLPIHELVEEFTPYFFTSSFAWMLAMAMKAGAKEIGMYGIDMASRDEYILQRPGAYYFFTEAHRRGIKITIPKESDLLQPPPLYGYSESTPFGRKMAAREKELKDRIAGMQTQLAQLDKNIAYLQGALEDIDYMRNIWGGVTKPEIVVK